MANRRPHFSTFFGETKFSRSQLVYLHFINLPYKALPEISYLQNPENVGPHSSNSLWKMQLHYSQSSRENATPSSGTTLLAYY